MIILSFDYTGFLMHAFVVCHPTTLDIQGPFLCRCTGPKRTSGLFIEWLQKGLLCRASLRQQPEAP